MEAIRPSNNQQQQVVAIVQPSIIKPITPQSVEPRTDNHNGLAKPEAAPVAATHDVKGQETVKQSSVVPVEKPQVTNGVTEGDPSAESANEAERTKMSFLLN